MNIGVEEEGGKSFGTVADANTSMNISFCILSQSPVAEREAKMLFVTSSPKNEDENVQLLLPHQLLYN